jgi:tetratricopeptide (TPR) repeat protein
MKKLKMKFRLVVILNLLLVTLNGLSQKDTTKAGILDQAMVTPKLIAARHEYNENNMRGSLLIYREILDTDPNNASALFGSSQCNYNLKKYKLALEYLDKAVAADPNVSSEIDFFLWTDLPSH